MTESFSTIGSLISFRQIMFKKTYLTLRSNDIRLDDADSVYEMIVIVTIKKRNKRGPIDFISFRLNMNAYL